MPPRGRQGRVAEQEEVAELEAVSSAEQTQTGLTACGKPAFAQHR